MTRPLHCTEPILADYSLCLELRLELCEYSEITYLRRTHLKLVNFMFQSRIDFYLTGQLVGGIEQRFVRSLNLVRSNGL